MQDPAAENLIEITRGGYFGWLAIPRIVSGISIWIQGWLLRHDREPIYRVRARAGKEMWPGQYGIPRPDVETVVPGNPNASCCGFSIDLPATIKSVELRLEAKYGHGRWNSFYRDKIALDDRGIEKPTLARILPRSLRQGSRFVPKIHYPLLPAYNLWFDEPLDCAGAVAKQFGCFGFRDLEWQQFRAASCADKPGAGQ